MSGSRPPRLTIGLPVYNGEAYLEQALDCILGQTYRDFVLILSDNASTDRTRAICEAAQARDSRVRYVRQERNLGASANFNFVFRASETELFKWAAHDDLMHPDFLRRVVELLDASPRAAVANSWCDRIDGASRVIGNFDNQRTLLDPRPSRRLAAMFRLGYPSAIWGVMRRADLLRTRLFESHLGSDWNLLAELLLMGELALVPEYLMSVRDHRGAFSFGLQGEPKRVRLRWFDPAARSPAVGAARSLLRFTQAPVRHRLPAAESAACVAQVSLEALRKAGAVARRARRRFARGSGAVAPSAS